MENIIKLNRESLNQVVSRVLHENLLKEARNTDVCPIIAHTNNAFKEGEFIFLRMQRKFNGEIKWMDKVAKIVGFDGDKLKVWMDGKGYLIDKQYPKLRSTDTWRYVFDMINEGHNDSTIDHGDIKIDYQVVDGDDSVVVYLKNKFKNAIVWRYRYDDVRNAMKTREVLKGIPMKVTTEQDKTGLWIKPGQTIPMKSKNPVPDAQELKKSWVVTKRTGSTFGGSAFEGWNLAAAQEICNECPWLRDTDAWWIDTSGGGRVKKKTTPANFH